MVVAEIHRRLRRGFAVTSVVAVVIAVVDLAVLIVVLRRWIGPADLGTATMGLALSPALEAAAGLGLGASLVRSSGMVSRSEIAALRRLVRGAAAATTLVAALVAVALGHAHGDPRVTLVGIAVAAKVAIQSQAVVPLALMRRELLLGRVALVRLLAAAGDAATKLAVAAAGYPVAALATAPLAYGVIQAVAAHALGPAPGDAGAEDAEVDTATHLRFGWRSASTQMLLLAVGNVDYLVVGRIFGAAALGLYRAAYDAIFLCVQFVTTISTELAFTGFARFQAQPEALRRHFVDVTRRNVALAVPALVFLTAAAEDVLAIVAPAYVDAAGLVRLLALVGLLRAATFSFPSLLEAAGRPAESLRFGVACLFILPVAFVAVSLLAAAGGVASAWPVAVAWLAGYPLALAPLARRTMAALALRLRDFAASLVRPIGAGFLAVLLAFVVDGVVGAGIPRLVVSGALAALAGAVALRRLDQRAGAAA